MCKTEAEECSQEQVSHQMHTQQFYKRKDCGLACDFAFSGYVEYSWQPQLSRVFMAIQRNFTCG